MSNESYLLIITSLVGEFNLPFSFPSLKSEKCGMSALKMLGFLPQTPGASQMCHSLDSPHPLTPSPKNGRRRTRIMSPLSHVKGEGLGGEGKDLSLHSASPNASCFSQLLETHSRLR
jgi:hypothetical protein